MEPVVLQVSVGEDVLPLAAVTVYNEGLTAIVFSGTTDVAGEVATGLPAGTYKVLVFLLGYSFEQMTLVVEEGGGTYPVSGDLVVVPPPSSPSVCRLYAFLRNQDGTGRPDVRLTVYVIPSPVHDVAEMKVDKATDEDGYVFFDVVRGIRVRVTILGRGVTREITVPDSPTADIFDVVGATPDPFQPVVT